MKVFRVAGANLFMSVNLKNLNAISAQLRHSNVGTTQRYYAYIQLSNVARRLGDTYKNIKIPEPKEPKKKK